MAVAVVVGVLAGVLSLLVLGGKAVEEAACNQKGSEYGLAADYRLLSLTCYVELSDGRKIDAERVRVIERGGPR